jgi:two-component system sensor histidine kinase DctS
MLFGQETREPLGQGTKILPARQGWRLALPLAVTASIMAIAGVLLLASQAIERNRQEQRLIADALWAEQSLEFEAQRMLDSLLALARSTSKTREAASGGRLEDRSLLQRHPAVVSIYRWLPGKNSFEVAGEGGLSDRDAAGLREAAQRAERLRRPTAVEPPTGDDPKAAALLWLAIPSDLSEGGQIVIAVVSLDRLLQNAIPWWLAHSTSITLQDSAGSVLAERDPAVRGAGVYVRKIETPFLDQTLYLNANSAQGRPFLIPDLLALSVACLSALLAWTVYALWRDLGSRTRTEAALRAQQALQDAMETSLVTGLRACDLEGRVTHANPAFCDMLGYTLDDLKRMTPPMPYWIGPGGGVPSDESRHKPYESRFMRPDGRVVDVLMHEAPLLDGSGRQVGWMASIQDVSEQKQNAELMREQADRIQKMSRLMSMGEMASALAHELNQPLSAATSYISAGLNLIADPEDETSLDDATRYFGNARSQAERAGEIIKRVRQFVGHTTPTLTPVNLAVVVNDLLALIRLQSSEASGKVKTTLEDGLPPVLADQILLEQIILNLTKNAFEAMVHIEPARKEVRISCTRRDANEVMVAVSDRGEGLGADRDRILSSTFLTTKPGGLGMGLAVCRSALELLGSKLDYRTGAEGGAEFFFILRPVHLAAVERSPAPEASSLHRA